MTKAKPTKPQPMKKNALEVQKGSNQNMREKINVEHEFILQRMSQMVHEQWEEFYANKQRENAIQAIVYHDTIVEGELNKDGGFDGIRQCSSQTT